MHHRGVIDKAKITWNDQINPQFAALQIEMKLTKKQQCQKVKYMQLYFVYTSICTGVQWNCLVLMSMYTDRLKMSCYESKTIIISYLSMFPPFVPPQLL